MEAISWSPNHDELQSTVTVLQALRDPSRPDHQQAMLGLEGFAANPSFVLHLLHIFVRGAQYVSLGLSSDFRSLGGFVIKNYVLANIASLPPQVVHQLKFEMLAALSDPLADISNTSGIIFGKLTSSYPIEIWGDLLPPMFTMLTDTTPEVVLGALSAIKRICEDSPSKLLSTQAVLDGRSILDLLIPRLLGLLSNAVSSIRLQALESMKALIPLLVPPSPSDDQSLQIPSIGHGREAFIIHLPSFLQAIGPLAADPVLEVRVTVCQCIVAIAATHLAVLEPAFQTIFLFMESSLADESEAIAMEACEFFAILAENDETRGVLASRLSVVLPTLIGRLKLGHEQLMQERADEEAQATGAKGLNHKPVHRKVAGENADDNDDDHYSLWTLRKQAALLLDGLSVTFDPQLLVPHCLPEIQRRLQSADVWDRELAMLALGALCAGCVDYMEAYLPSLFPLFIQSTKDEVPEMRSTSCWVLARYSGWLFGGEDVSALFVPSFHAMLQAMIDPKTIVQGAGCSALCTLMDNARDSVVPLIGELLAVIQHCLGVYGIKCTMLLYDTISSLADSVGDHLGDPSFTPMYMPSILRHLQRYEDTDMLLLPLLECFTAVTEVIGQESVPYASSIFMKCFRILVSTMSAYASADPDVVADAPVKDFAICSLDVLSALCTGLREQFQDLLSAADVASPGTCSLLLQYTLQCTVDPLPECRQSAFSLIGELAKSAPVIFSFGTFFPDVMAACLRNLDSLNILVCNNACWAIGEIAIQIGGEGIHPYVGRLMQTHIQLMTDPELNINLKANLGVTVGRLCLTNTAQVMDMITEAFDEFCSCLKFIGLSSERDQAFAGLIAVLNANSGILASRTAASSFILACASWEDIPDDKLLGDIRTVLLALKQSHPQWREVMKRMDTDLRDRFMSIFRLV